MKIQFFFPWSRSVWQSEIRISLTHTENHQRQYVKAARTIQKDIIAFLCGGTWHLPKGYSHELYVFPGRDQAHHFRFLVGAEPISYKSYTDNFPPSEYYLSLLSVKTGWQWAGGNWGIRLPGHCPHCGKQTVYQRLEGSPSNMLCWEDCVSCGYESEEECYEDDED